MGRFTAATLALLLGSGSPAAVVGRRDGPQTRIIDGNVAPVERYPYVVPLIDADFGAPLCGGSLIHPRVVLTAAHCVPPTAPPAALPPALDVGRWDWTTIADGDAFDTIAVEDHAVHPGWNGLEPSDAGYAPDDPDFALVLLAAPSAMTPVRLARDGADAPVGGTAAVLGFGVTNSGQNRLSPRLKEAAIRLAPSDTCGLDEAADGTRPTPDHVGCGRRIDGDPCVGDDGGPLVVPDAGGDAAGDVLVGVVSYGPGRCGDWDGHAAYAKVAWGRAWIEETLGGWGLALPADAPTTGKSKSGKPQKSSRGSKSTKARVRRQ